MDTSTLGGERLESVRGPSLVTRARMLFRLLIRSWLVYPHALTTCVDEITGQHDSPVAMLAHERWYSWAEKTLASPEWAAAMCTASGRKRRTPHKHCAAITASPPDAAIRARALGCCVVFAKPADVVAQATGDD
jgi:hypothetical protein